MAIYTTLTKKEVHKIADEFGLGDITAFSGVRNGSVNTHYLVETKRGKFFVKIDEVKSEIEVKQELELLLHLKNQGFPCLQPVKSKNGRVALELEGKCLTVTKYLDGAEVPLDALTTTQLNALGHALSSLHLNGRTFKKGIENRFSFPRVAAIYRDVRRRCLPISSK